MKYSNKEKNIQRKIDEHTRHTPSHKKKQKNDTHAHVNRRKLQAVKTANECGEKKDFNSFDIINYG